MADPLEQRDLGFPLEQPDTSPCADAIEEELQARGWTIADLAIRMGTAEEYGLNYLSIEVLFACRRDKNVIVDQEMADRLGRAFDVSPQLFMNLHNNWRLAQ